MRFYCDDERKRSNLDLFRNRTEYRYVAHGDCRSVVSLRRWRRSPQLSNSSSALSLQLLFCRLCEDRAASYSDSSLHREWEQSEPTECGRPRDPQHFILVETCWSSHTLTVTAVKFNETFGVWSGSLRFITIYIFEVICPVCMHLVVRVLETVIVVEIVEVFFKFQFVVT